MLRLIRFITVTTLALALSVILYATGNPAQADTPDMSDAFSISTKDGLSLTLSEDGRVVALAMDGDPLPITPAPALWVRDMSAAGQVSEPNLLTNPGFEDGETGWQMGYQVGTDITFTDTVSHSGGWSLQLHGTQTENLGRATMIADPVDVIPGQRYRLSAYLLSSRGYVLAMDGTPPKRQDQVWRGLAWPNGIYLSWLDGDGEPLSDVVLAAPLHWEAHSWRKVSGEVRAPPEAAQLELTIGGRLQDEYLWVDDLNIIASPEMEQPVTGTVTQQGEQLIQTATITAGLTLTATYTAESDHIAVDVELQDTAGLDRALEVIVALPVDADGWHWWDDVRHNRPITASSAVASPPPEYPLPPCLSWTYEHVVSGVWDGWLPISLYPYALIEDGRHGLALAASLDSPQLVKLAYDQEQRRYEARGYLGISPLATKLEGRADLSLELYRVDPAWGFRGAMDRFAARHPTWFESPRPMYDYNGYDRSYYMTEAGAQQVLEYDQQGIFTAQYIVAESPLKDGPVSEPMPTYEETIELVEELGNSPKEGELAESAAITSSVAYSPNGDWMIKHVGEYSWAPGVWEVAWQTSTDPDIEGGWGPYLWNWGIAPAIEATEAINAVLDGVMMDNFMSATGVDTRPDHLALTDTPLTYNVATYQPGVHNAANVDEFFLWLRDTLEAEGRDDMAITINFWGIATPNGLARHIDAFGGEGGSKTKAYQNWHPRILDYRRAIAYHKPQAWANGEPDLTLDDVQEFVDLALFYAILPGRKDEATNWEPGSDQLITDTQQVLFQFWGAGWEPVTHAWTDDEAVWAERFGSRFKASDFSFQVDNPQPETQNPKIHFTVHNTLTETIPFTLTVDAAALGIAEPERLMVVELVSGDVVQHEVLGDLVLIWGELAPLDTLVFRLEEGLAPTTIYLPLVLKAHVGGEMGLKAMEPVNGSDNNHGIKVVDPINGDDENPGTPEQPWKTLFKAGRSAEAGDTVIVKSGIYNEWLTPFNSGTADAPIVFKSEVPMGAHLTGLFELEEAAVSDWVEASETEWPDGVWQRQLASWNFAEAYRDGERMPSPIADPNRKNIQPGMSWVDYQTSMLYVWMEDENPPFDYQHWQITASHGVHIGSNYITVEGFDIEGFGKDGVKIHQAKHVMVRNNFAHHNGRAGIAINESNHTLVEGNEASYNGYGMGWSSGISVWRATGKDNLVQGNISHHNWDGSDLKTDGNGFIVDLCQETGGGATLINNVAYENGGSGFRVYASDNGRMINNTSICNGRDPEQFNVGEMSVWPKEEYGPLANMTIVNNIFYACGNQPALTISHEPVTDSWDMDYNLYYKKSGGSDVIYDHQESRFITLESFHEKWGQDANSLVADPLFDEDRFHLQQSSPSVDAGLEIPQVTEDIDGDPRPQGQGYDIGADELVP